MSDDFDAIRFKAMERAGFNRIARQYDDAAHLRASLQDALIDIAAPQTGEHWLDVASGPGLLARALAPRVAPNGSVLATDIAESMLVHARTVVVDGSLPIDFVTADAEGLCLRDAAFDGATLGLGLFAFPHPERALAEVHRVLKPGGRLALSVWGAAGSVPLIERAQQCIARNLPPPKIKRPSVFRFGERGVLETALQRAGFSAIEITPHPFTCHFTDADAFWDAFLSLAGGATEALSRLPETTRAHLRAAVADDLTDFAQADGYRVPALTLIARALR